MSRLPALLSAIKRKHDSAPRAEAAAGSPQAEPSGTSLSEAASDGSAPKDNVVDLVPPKAADDTGARMSADDAKRGRNIHPIGVTDLSRLSIDNDGRLYWDGKPVEVRRRIHMSRTQVLATSIVAGFLMVGAVGAAIQGTAAMRDWACRLGWISSTCTLPGALPGRSSDIPA